MLTCARHWGTRVRAASSRPVGFCGRLVPGVALGARRRAGSTYALSITGAPGPDLAGDKVPLGTMYVGLADAAGTIALHRQFLGDRQRIRTFAVQMALDLLRRRITGRP
jgi:nicotinamide-nucleotide amidase